MSTEPGGRVSLLLGITYVRILLVPVVMGLRRLGAISALSAAGFGLVERSFGL